MSDVNLFQVQTPSTSSDTKTGAVLLQSSFSMPGPDHPVDEVERPGLLQSLSLPSSDTPYHRLRRASHHIISGVHVDFEYICYIKILLQYLRCFCERDFCNFHILGGSLIKQQQVQQLQQRSHHQTLDDSFSVMYCTLFIFLLGCFVLGKVL